MSIKETVTGFNSLASVLNRLRSFNVLVSSGKLQVNTDGQGLFWVDIEHHDDSTGILLSTEQMYLNIGSLADAQAEIVTLQTILQSATLIPPPPIPQAPVPVLPIAPTPAVPVPGTPDPTTL